jgi:predicted nucleic acid-binding protein
MSDLVLDNSAAIQFATRSPTDETNAQYYAPELIDLEYASTLRKLVARDEVTPEEAQRYLQEWAGNALIRCTHAMLLPRIWELRDNITPYDAAYVALAEILDLPLVTADLRLARAASAYCEVVTVGAA